ncbi:MAG: DoxX family membrane protein [Candidatus Omnitrophica bacterium]|nr:DoxX family membrane protein [Candidatus Omnitrophota bacterium]
MNINIFVFIRIFIGLIYLVSGFEKIISPYQNFQYVIQSYTIVPSSWEIIIAKTFPWIELFTGLFLFFGLWTRISLFSALIISGTLMTIVGQAMIRQLPITECGCFGELISLPLWAVFIIDVSTFLSILLLLKKYQKTILLSLDRHFNE